MIDDVDDDGADGGYVVSLPLPKDHWVYEPTGEPPSPIPIPIALDRDRMRAAIWEAGRCAVGGATMSGRSPHFDLDALGQIFVVGLLGSARPEAQLMGTKESTPKSVALALHSPESGGGYPDPEKPEIAATDETSTPEKCNQP